MKLEHQAGSTRFDGFYEDTDGTIHIAAGLGPLEAECVFFHERQHRTCHQTGCSCWGRKTDYLAEKHAYAGELRDVIRRKSPALAKAYFKQIERSLVKFKADRKQWAIHNRALRMIIRSQEFRSLTAWYHK